MGKTKIQLKDLFNVMVINQNICDKEFETKLKTGLKTHNLPDFQTLQKDVFHKPLGKKRLSLALLDKDGGVIVDEKGGFKFGREETQELIDYVEELNDQAVEFDFYTTKFEDLSDSEKASFCKVDDSLKIVYISDINQDTFDKMSYFITGLPEYIVESISKEEVLSK